MKHTMAAPCKECPFRNDLPHGYLRAERITEIVESLLRGVSFPCHKTTVEIESENGFSDLEADENSLQCAGAEIFLAKQGTSTQMSRIAERLGMPVATLDMDAAVCGSHREMLTAHGHDEESEYEPCSVADYGCLHPAGYMMGGGVVECTDGEETFECSECGEFVCEACSERGVCNNCREDADD